MDIIHKVKCIKYDIQTSNASNKEYTSRKDGEDGGHDTRDKLRNTTQPEPEDEEYTARTSEKHSQKPECSNRRTDKEFRHSQSKMRSPQSAIILCILLCTSSNVNIM